MIEQATCSQDHCVNKDELEKAAADTDPAELGVHEWARDEVGKRSGDPRRLEGLIAPGEYVINANMDARKS